MGCRGFSSGDAPPSLCLVFRSPDTCLRTAGFCGRWDPSRPASLGNLVLLTREEADAHDAEVGAPGGMEQLRARDPGLCARVEAVLRRAAREFEHSYY